MSGRGRNAKNPWGSTQKNAWTKNAKAVPQNQPNKKNAEQKFKEAQNKLQEAVQKHIKEYESSSDEEELETENVIETILKRYEATGMKSDVVGRTKGFLEEVFISGASTCLICISSIKRNDSIWSCTKCYCFFHLMCIQRWSKDTIMQMKQALEEQIIARKITMKWGCPKCRNEYDPDDIPSEYFCFCGKAKNPEFQALLAPHSCGETCGKSLNPRCGHECVLLCHPGPCPPCPVTVKVSCYCRGSPQKIQRCSNKEWSCGATCSKLLACGKHKCSEACHSGECRPCPKKSMQRCLCGGEVKLRDCATPVWQCEKVCSKPLSCGFHNCDQICHPGECDDCTLSKLRTCPCGKSSYQLPCTEETPTCGDTCGKVLECEMHVCNERCHKGKCMSCVETVVKSCRCGMHQKEIQCKKQYLCETKCKQMKDCNKHPCNRKCCDGNCPPCEKPCGRTLNCRKHSCTSVCHRGPCYPCNLSETVSCRCESTSITVPCGKKSRTRPPKCLKFCTMPPECHHKAREPHRCHFGDCPPCRQYCNKSRPNCTHLCPAPCHTSVLVKIEGQKATTPWEETGPLLTKQALPCPDCVVPVPVTCLGKHETCDYPCYLAKPSSCYKNCGRILSCENHNCTKTCHTVEGQEDPTLAGKNCEQCISGCTKERPKNCTHQCPNPCHPGPCPPCKQMVRIKCHCGLTQPYIPCKYWTGSVDLETLQSCGNQCPKNYPCGHRCRANCHSGDCPNPEQCKKKVKITCPCKRIKKEFSCETNRKGQAVLKCDDECIKKQEEDKKLQERMDAERRKEEEIKNQKELEMFEKKFSGKKKNRDRRVVEEMDDRTFIRKYWVLLSGVLVLSLSIVLILVK